MQDENKDETNQVPKVRKHRKGLTRIAAACLRCRKRKQKCDEKVPTCTPCKTAGVACVLSERLTVVAGSDPSDETFQEELTHLREQVRDLSKQLTEERTRNFLQTQAELRNSHYTQQPVTPRLNNNTVQYGPSGLIQEAESPIVYPSTTYSGRILRPTFAYNEQSKVDAGDKSSAWSLWKDDHSVETPTAHPAAESISYNPDQARALIDIFFEQRWPHLPVLHKPAFLREHFGPFAAGEIIPAASRFQLFMVFAIAALEQGRVRGANTYSHKELFDTAVRDLGVILSLDDESCIRNLLLLCIYGRVEPQSVNMWYTTGLTLRIAIGMDLHRAQSIKHMGLFEAEMAKRLFWSVYAMDRSMSIYLGRPLGIQDADIDMPFPLQLTDEDLEAQTLTTVVPRVKPNVRDMSTFIHLIKLRRLNADIYRTFHSVTKTSAIPEKLADVREELFSQLNDWLITAPRYPVTSSMFQSTEWFQTAYHLATLALHRPSSAQPTPSIEALRLCADSSISLISCYGSLYAKNKVSYSFVALSAIFIAAVTMLYSLRASPQVRKDLSKQVVETNINSCLTLLRGISNGREVAERAARVISGLGNAVLSLFDNEDINDAYQPQANVDQEFLSWFGLKSKIKKGNEIPLEQQTQWQPDDMNVILPGEPMTTLSVDMAWEDLFAQGFGMDSSTGMDFFPHTGF